MKLVSKVIPRLQMGDYIDDVFYKMMMDVFKLKLKQNNFVLGFSNLICDQIMKHIQYDNSIPFSPYEI